MPAIDPSFRPLLGLLACLLMQDAIAATPPIQVRLLGCANGVHLVADKAPVSDVLDELARVAGFRIAAKIRIPTPITVDSIQSTQRLLDMILSDENTIVKVEADAVCPGRFKVAEVWIVEKGSPSIGSTPLPAPKKAPTPAPITPEAKAQDDLYRQAHGLPIE